MSCVKNTTNTNSNNNGTSSGKKKRASLDSLDLSSSYESLSPDQVERTDSPKNSSDVDLSWLAYLIPGNRCRVTRSGVKLPVVVKSAALMKQPWTICPFDNKKHHSCHHHQEHSAAKRSSCSAAGVTGGTIQRRMQ